MRTEQGMMSLELVESLVHYCVVVGPFMGARGSDSLTPRYTPPYVYPGLLFFFSKFRAFIVLDCTIYLCSVFFGSEDCRVGDSYNLRICTTVNDPAQNRITAG